MGDVQAIRLRRGDEADATRYAFELTGYLGRLGRYHAVDVLETFRAAVAMAQAPLAYLSPSRFP